jgi:Carboxypeptidase regulatory-like domain
VVSGRDNEPLALVQVELSGTPFSAVTAADGTFRITGVPAGAYVLQASSVGYRMVRQDLLARPGLFPAR